MTCGGHFVPGLTVMGNTAGWKQSILRPKKWRGLCVSELRAQRESYRPPAELCLQAPWTVSSPHMMMRREGNSGARVSMTYRALRRSLTRSEERRVGKE